MKARQISEAVAAHYQYVDNGAPTCDGFVYGDPETEVTGVITTFTVTAEVLGVMRQLAADHVTMVVVTHEMSFAREAANKVLFVCDGGIAEAAAPQQLFLHPRDPRVAAFLGAAAGKN